MTSKERKNLSSAINSLRVWEQLWQRDAHATPFNAEKARQSRERYDDAVTALQSFGLDIIR